MYSVAYGGLRCMAWGGRPVVLHSIVLESWNDPNCCKLILSSSECETWIKNTAIAKQTQQSYTSSKNKYNFLFVMFLNRLIIFRNEETFSQNKNPNLYFSIKQKNKYICSVGEGTTQELGFQRVFTAHTLSLDCENCLLFEHQLDTENTTQLTSQHNLSVVESDSPTTQLYRHLGTLAPNLMSLPQRTQEGDSSPTNNGPNLPRILCAIRDRLPRPRSPHSNPKYIYSQRTKTNKGLIY